jgi:hypothetical protein
MQHIFLTTSFGQKLVGTTRLCWTTLQLAWKAIPVLLVSMLLLFGIQAGLLPLQLALSRAVIDRLIALAGHTAVPDPIVHDVTLAVVSLGQLLAPLIAVLQSRASDRLTGYLTEQVMLAANRWSRSCSFWRRSRRWRVSLSMSGRSAGISLLQQRRRVACKRAAKWCFRPNLPRTYASTDSFRFSGSATRRSWPRQLVP